jgi:hypothetical protein
MIKDWETSPGMASLAFGDWERSITGLAQGVYWIGTERDYIGSQNK